MSAATSAQTMKGSLPPISRLTRATRSAQRGGDPLAGRDRAGERDAVDALVGDDPLADVAGAGEQVDDAGRQVLEARREHQRRERRQLRRLADDGVAGRERGRELPGEQQQRVVPGHDAPDDADRLLEHERELRRLDRRDHAAGEVAAHLGVVVERGGGPADLVGVLDQRLAALERHHAGRARRCARAAGSRPRAASRPRSTAGVRRPAVAASRAAAIAASTCSADAARPSATVSSVEGFSTASAARRRPRPARPRSAAESPPSRL